MASIGKSQITLALLKDGADGTAGTSTYIAPSASRSVYSNTLSYLTGVQNKTDSWSYTNASSTVKVGDVILMPCKITDLDNTSAYLPCTITKVEANRVTGTNGYLIYGKKGEDGVDGKDSPGIYRCSVNLTTSTTVIARTNIATLPNRNWMKGDLIVDLTGLGFAVTADTALSSSTIPVGYRTNFRGAAGKIGASVATTVEYLLDSSATLTEEEQSGRTGWVEEELVTWSYGKYLYKRLKKTNYDTGAVTYTYAGRSIEVEDYFKTKLYFALTADRTTFVINKRQNDTQTITLRIDQRYYNPTSYTWTKNGESFTPTKDENNSDLYTFEISTLADPISLKIEVIPDIYGTTITGVSSSVILSPDDQTDYYQFLGLVATLPTGTDSLLGDSCFYSTENAIYVFDGSSWVALVDSSLADNIKTQVLFKAEKTAFEYAQENGLSDDYGYFDTLFTKYVYARNIGAETITLNGDNGKLVGGDWETLDADGYLANRGAYIDATGLARFTWAKLNNCNIRGGNIDVLSVTGELVNDVLKTNQVAKTGTPITVGRMDSQNYYLGSQVGSTLESVLTPNTIYDVVADGYNYNKMVYKTGDLGDRYDQFYVYTEVKRYDSGLKSVALGPNFAVTVHHGILPSFSALKYSSSDYTQETMVKQNSSLSGAEVFYGSGYFWLYKSYSNLSFTASADGKTWTAIQGAPTSFYSLWNFSTDNNFYIAYNTESGSPQTIIYWSSPTSYVKKTMPTYLGLSIYKSQPFEHNNQHYILSGTGYFNIDEATITRITTLPSTALLPLTYYGAVHYCDGYLYCPCFEDYKLVFYRSPFSSEELSWTKCSKAFYFPYLSSQSIYYSFLCNNLVVYAIKDPAGDFSYFAKFLIKNGVIWLIDYPCGNSYASDDGYITTNAMWRALKKSDNEYYLYRRYPNTKEISYIYRLFVEERENGLYWFYESDDEYVSNVDMVNFDTSFKDKYLTTRAVSVGDLINLPTTIPSGMDFYRKIPKLYDTPQMIMSVASINLEAYTRFDTTIKADVEMSAVTTVPSRVDLSETSLKVDNVEKLNSAWYIKNKTSLTMTVTPNAEVAGVKTGDINPMTEDNTIGAITPYKAIRVKQLLNLYPVGSIYMSVNDNDPAEIFGGTWLLIGNKFLYGGDTTATKYTDSNDEITSTYQGGASSVALGTANMPAHTHTRGTMNITGTFSLNGQPNSGISKSGAFYSYDNVSLSNGGITGNTWYGYAKRYYFGASNSWSGNTSSVGSGTAFSILPPFQRVNIWYRQA